MGNPTIGPLLQQISYLICYLYYYFPQNIIFSHLIHELINSFIYYSNFLHFLFLILTFKNYALDAYFLSLHLISVKCSCRSLSIYIYIYVREDTSMHECQYNITAFSPFYQHFEKSVGSIFSTYPPDHSKSKAKPRNLLH